MNRLRKTPEQWERALAQGVKQLGAIAHNNSIDFAVRKMLIAVQRDPDIKPRKLIELVKGLKR